MLNFFYLKRIAVKVFSFALSAIFLPISYLVTVCKFHEFSITQILREINFRESGSAKSAVLTNLEALNFEFYEFLHFLNAKIYQITKIQST